MNVFPATQRKILLTQAFRPAKTLKDKPDQIVFGLAFVGGLCNRKPIKDGPELPLKRGEIGIVKSLPVGELDDRFPKEIV